MKNDFFMHFIVETVQRIYQMNTINIWSPPPLKTVAKSLVYLFTFNAAPFRVLSWLTDDSFSLT